MTSAEAPAACRGAVARGWRNFRRWRRGRPFWGGLFTMLAGLEILAAGQLTLGDLQVKVGLEGFQAYVIPAMLVLAGVLTWITPAQRIFYGVLAALVSVYSLIGSNFGGFMVGMLLGIVGGALSASWVRVQPEPVETDDADEPPADAPDETPAADATVDDLLTGPLTDVLPTSTESPVPRPRQTHEANEDQPGPGGALPRRSPRLLAITLIPVSLAVAAVAALPAQRPALADPCPAPKPPAATTKPPLTTTPAVSPTTSPPAGSPGGGGNPIAGIIGGVLGVIGDLLGIGPSTPTPTPTPQPPPAGGPPAVGNPAPTPCTTTGPAPGTKPGATSSPGAAAPGIRLRTLAAPPGTPKVGARPGKLTGDSVTMFGLVLGGVVELERADNSKVRALKIQMIRSTVTDFKLVTFHPSGRQITITSPVLTVEGNVEFYASRFSGKLFGIIPVVLTPELPIPPLLLPPLPISIEFTDPEVDLVFVSCDRLTGRPVLNARPG